MLSTDAHGTHRFRVVKLIDAEHLKQVLVARLMFGSPAPLRATSLA